MKKKQDFYETYTDLIDESADPEIVQLIREMDAISQTPQPPARVSWTDVRTLYTKQTMQKKAALLPFPFLTRQHHLLTRKAVLVPILIGLFLMTTGFTVASSPLLQGVLGLEPSSQGLQFVNIHQTKMTHGATISLDKGYADSNQLIIGYTVSPANAHISFQAINLSTQQGVVLNQKGNDIIVGTSNSDGNTVATAWFFSTSSIPGKPGTLALRLSMVIGQTATLTKKAPVKTLATVNFDFTLPFHVGRVATLSQKATSHGKTITLERVTVSQAATRIVVQGLGTMDSMNGGLAGTLQVPWNWRSYNYGTASPGADGPDAWSFVYPYDFSQNQGGWTLTIQQGIYTWTFHFSVPM